MKQILINLVVLFYITTSFTQIVNIPDANFKNALVNTLCVAAEYQGNTFSTADFNNDGEIQVSEAESIQHLVVSVQEISDLEGIEAFINLKSLACGTNQLTYLDTSQNTELQYLSCGSNELTSLNVSQNINLITLHCSLNNIQSIDVTQNINLLNLSCGLNFLENIDISNNILLEELWAYNNQFINLDLSNNLNLRACILEFNCLETIDLSFNNNLTLLSIPNNNLTTLDLANNIALKQLNINNNPLIGNLDLSQNEELFGISCTNTLLSNINFKNGNNYNSTRMWAQDNPNLSCIQVDDVAYANNQECNINTSSGWCKDETAQYSEDCLLGFTEQILQDAIQIYPNPVKNKLNISKSNAMIINKISIYDALGKKVIETTGNQRQINLSGITKGLLLVKIETNAGMVVKKIIKE